MPVTGGALACCGNLWTTTHTYELRHGVVSALLAICVPVTGGAQSLL